MVDRQALIDWPLTPYTGWGGYGIQLAQALLEQRKYWPRLLASNDRSAFCDLHWLDALHHLEDQSMPFDAKSWLLLKEPVRLPFLPRQLLDFLLLAILFRRLASRHRHVGVTFLSAVASLRRIWTFLKI